MEVSKRINEIVDCIEYDTLVDIGTDHAYIPIKAMDLGLIKNAIASDINVGPILRAKEHILKKGYEKSIETRIGDGIHGIKKNDGKTLVVAGMGGMLVKQILKKDIEVAKSFNQIIIQPQLDVENVRRFMQTIDFYIEYEKYIIDKNKYYIILNYKKGNKNKYHDKEFVKGKNIYEDNINNYCMYLALEIKKIEDIIFSISNNKKEEKKVMKLREKMEILREALNEYK